MAISAKVNPRAAEIRDLSARRVERFRTAGADWRFGAGLKSLSEDTAQEYEGWKFFELIQNGHDPLETGPPDPGVPRLRRRAGECCPEHRGSGTATPDCSRHPDLPAPTGSMPAKRFGLGWYLGVLDDWGLDDLWGRFLTPFLPELRG